MVNHQVPSKPFTHYTGTLASPTAQNPSMKVEMNHHTTIVQEENHPLEEEEEEATVDLEHPITDLELRNQPNFTPIGTMMMLSE